MAKTAEIEMIRVGYKHVDEADAHFLEEGSILVRTLDSCKRIEAARSDHSEGRIIAEISKFDGDKNDPAEKALLAKAGIRIRGSSKGIRIEGIGIAQRATPCYLYCCSDRPDEEFARRERKAIFEIDDLSAIVDLVQDAGSQHLYCGAVGAVKYFPRVFDVLHWPSFPGADVYTKAMNYSWEREIRIAWLTKSMAPEDELVLRPPGLAGHFRRIF